jgi:hypothetical protein
VPDEFRAYDLTPAHVGELLQVRDSSGVTWRAVLLLPPRHVDDVAVQLLLDDGDGAAIVHVGAGAPVELAPG